MIPVTSVRRTPGYEPLLRFPRRGDARAAGPRCRNAFANRNTWRRPSPISVAASETLIRSSARSRSTFIRSISERLIKITVIGRQLPIRFENRGGVTSLSGPTVTSLSGVYSHHSHKRYYGILVRRRWGPAGLRGPAMPDRHSPCQPNRPMVPSRGGLKDFYPDRLKGSEFVLQKRKSGQFVGSCTLFL